MNRLPLSWQLFRILCILQLLMVATKVMLALSRIFNDQRIFVHFIEILVYAIMFLFLYQALSLLNYNYPDIPLSEKQKRQFNLLYILNFLLIAFLFGLVVSEYRLIAPMFGFIGISFKEAITFSAYFLFTDLVFVFHLIFLAGMFRLRRRIYQNTMNTWVRQFDDQKPDQ